MKVTIKKLVLEVILNMVVLVPSILCCFVMLGDCGKSYSKLRWLNYLKQLKLMVNHVMMILLSKLDLLLLNTAHGGDD